MKKLTEEWLKAAQDDLKVISKILGDESLTHIVAFHAQQSVEKAFKAVIEEQELDVHKIHNLVTLHTKIKQWLPTNIDLNLLRTLDSLYIESRYPGELGLLPNGRPTAADARHFNAFAEKILALIKTVLTG